MPEFKASNGKYFPRSAAYNIAECYWVAQFQDLLKRCKKVV